MRRYEVTRKGTIAEIARHAEEPDFVLVKSHFLVHERPGGLRPCPCCGGSTCQLVDNIPGPELIIDTSGGSRWLRHEMFR